MLKGGENEDESEGADGGKVGAPAMEGDGDSNRESHQQQHQWSTGQFDDPEESLEGQAVGAPARSLQEERQQAQHLGNRIAPPRPHPPSRASAHIGQPGVTEHGTYEEGEERSLPAAQGELVRERGAHPNKQIISQASQPGENPREQGDEAPTGFVPSGQPRQPGIPLPLQQTAFPAQLPFGRGPPGLGFFVGAHGLPGTHPTPMIPTPAVIHQPLPGTAIPGLGAGGPPPALLQPGVPVPGHFLVPAEEYILFRNVMQNVRGQGPPLAGPAFASHPQPALFPLPQGPSRPNVPMNPPQQPLPQQPLPQQPTTQQPTTLKLPTVKKLRPIQPVPGKRAKPLVAVKEDELKLNGISWQDITDSDVLLGRGGLSNIHPGNRVFRSLVDENRLKYYHAQKGIKRNIAAEVVAKIRENEGRFLKKDEALDLWFEVGDLKAIDKAGQNLREVTADMKRSKEEAATYNSSSSESSATSDHDEKVQHNPRECPKHQKGNSSSSEASVASDHEEKAQQKPKARSKRQKRKSSPSESSVTSHLGEKAQKKPKARSKRQKRTL